MKQRKGYVSNSSSSSYILLVNRASECDCCGIKPGEIFWALLDRPNYGSGEDTEIDAVGYNNILKNHDDTYIGEHFKEELLKAMEPYKAIQEDSPYELKLIEASIAYHDDVTEHILQVGIKTGAIKMVLNIGG